MSPQTAGPGRAVTKVCGGRVELCSPSLPSLPQAFHTHQPPQGGKARTHRANTPFCIELQHKSFSVL